MGGAKKAALTDLRMLKPIRGAFIDLLVTPTPSPHLILIRTQRDNLQDMSSIVPDYFVQPTGDCPVGLVKYWNIVLMINNVNINMFEIDQFVNCNIAFQDGFFDRLTHHAQYCNIQGAPKKMHHSDLYTISVLEVGFYFFACVL